LDSNKKPVLDELVDANFNRLEMLDVIKNEESTNADIPSPSF